MAAEQYLYDVFLSHSSNDKDVVRPLAKRLQGDGLRVWFDEWEIKPDDSIPAKIEEGLEYSRVLVLCMSANAFGSDWAQLEAGTFRFRDPLNRERRFIPLRFDDTPINGSLAQFLYINWITDTRVQNYQKLFDACRPTSKISAKRHANLSDFSEEKVVTLGYGLGVWSVTWSHDFKRVLSGSEDNAVRLWDMKSGDCLAVLEGHTGSVWSVSFSPDGSHALSGSYDNTVRLWDVESGQCLAILEGHTGCVWSVSMSPDGNSIISGSADNTVILWDTISSKCLAVFSGHTKSVSCVSWCPDCTRVISGSSDNTLRLWDVEAGCCEKILEGHTGGIWSISWSPDGRRVISGSSDNTVRLWEVKSGRCLLVLEGHLDSVKCVSWSPDGCFALSGSSDNTVRLWDMVSGRCLAIFDDHSKSVWDVAWSLDGTRVFSSTWNGVIRVWNLTRLDQEISSSQSEADKSTTEENQVQYTNAKVLLVGDSGVGKTGLANRLAKNLFEETISTDGAWATHWPLRHTNNGSDVEREVWLWDFAGQVDYRLVHQLFMDETSVAVLVFNPQNENPFEGLGQWDRDLQKATRKPFAKLLVAGRVDRGGLVVSRTSVERFIKERGFLGSLNETSAKTGEGCNNLYEAIVNAIDWENIPTTTSPVLFRKIKQQILQLRDSGMVLIRLAELKQRMELTLLQELFKLEELQTVVSLLAGPGMIQRVDFGGYILLRPEVLSRYAAAVVRKVRKHPQELGCISEDEMLTGNLDYQDFKRLPCEDEAVVLRILHEIFISRAWCLRQICDGAVQLTFPSYFRRERPDQPSHPNVLVTYRINGPVEEIYATLVVLLHHAVGFETDQLWKFAADFKNQSGKNLGMKLTRETEGAARLEVYFASDVDENSSVLFLRYVHDHLIERAQNVQRLRNYYCGNRKCDARDEPFRDLRKIDKALMPGGKGKVFCPDCGKSILLRDLMEEKLESSEIKEKVHQMEAHGQQVISNESQELILVGHVFAITAEAGQIYRGYTNSDHGIDGEIEFKDDQGHATGRKIYLQLKIGDSYLSKRSSDGEEYFSINDDRQIQYWMGQAFPVVLLIRNSVGEVRWMDVHEKLKHSNVKQYGKHIVFEGERFDVMSVRRWRDRILRELI